MLKTPKGRKGVEIFVHRRPDMSMPAQAAVVIGFHGKKARRQLRRRHLATLKAGNGDLKPAGGWRSRPREAVAGGELLKVAGTVVG